MMFSYRNILYFCIIVITITILININTTENFQDQDQDQDQDKDVKIRVDPLDYYNKYKTDQSYKVAYREDHYVLSISKKNIKPLIGCVYNLEGLKVGYVTRSGYNVAKAIVKGHRMDDSNITYTKINKKLINLGSVDIAIITQPKSKIDELLQDPYLHIFGFGDMDIHRVKAFYPFVEGSLRDIRSITVKDPRAKIENNPSTLVLEIKPFVLEKKTKTKTKNKEIRETFNGDSDRYACYGMPEVLNKHLCNSPYDHIGNPKPYFSTWDKMCREDTECPFYRVNGDERGGCIKETGQCDMPIGIKKLGFTKYTDEGKYAPFKYPDGDYVFQNDTQSRIKNKRDIVAKDTQ